MFACAPRIMLTMFNPVIDASMSVTDMVFASSFLVISQESPTRPTLH